MKLNVVEIGSMSIKDKTFDYLKGLTNVLRFGKRSLELITVKVSNKAKYKLGENDIDIILPYSEYTYQSND